jgi:ABC-type transport system involved in multi-copper enzyme maturation permease subunit
MTVRALTVAANTVREALRERLMYNLVIFALILIAASVTISQLTLGEQFRVIADIGASSTQIFGTLIAVFVGVGLLSRELDRRTCYPALARPVSRAGFIVGKYLGLLATLALNLAVMAAANALTLALFSRGAGFLRLSFFGAFGLMLAQFAICAAFAILFTSFSTATLAAIFTLAIVAAGYVFSEIRPFWLQNPSVQMKQLVRVLDFTIPNMGLLDLKEAITYGDAVGLWSILLRGLYGFGYAAAVVALAALVFSRRDIR